MSSKCFFRATSFSFFTCCFLWYSKTSLLSWPLILFPLIVVDVDVAERAHRVHAEHTGLPRLVIVVVLYLVRHRWAIRFQHSGPDFHVAHLVEHCALCDSNGGGVVWIETYHAVLSQFIALCVGHVVTAQRVEELRVLRQLVVEVQVVVAGEKSPEVRLIHVAHRRGRLNHNFP